MVHRIIPYAFLITSILLGSLAVRSMNRGESDATPVPLPVTRDESDCGPTALYMICRADERSITLEDARLWTNVSIVGTDMYSLREAARKCGFVAEGFSVSFASLDAHLAEPRRYAILYCSNGHFVAALRSRDKHLLVVDRALGAAYIAEDQLRSDFQWDGTAILLSPKG